MIKVWKWRSFAICPNPIGHAEPEHVGVELYAPTEEAFWDHFYERIGKESGHPLPGEYAVNRTKEFYLFGGTKEDWEIAVEFDRVRLTASLS